LYSTIKSEDTVNHVEYLDVLSFTESVSAWSQIWCSGHHLPDNSNDRWKRLCLVSWAAGTLCL